MTRPLQTLGVLLLGGLAVGLPWLTGVTAGAAWLSAHRAIVETPLTTLAVAAFGLTGAAVALAEPWLGAFVVWAGLSLFRIGWPGMTEAVLPIALGAVMIVGLQRVPPVLDLRAWGARRVVVRRGVRLALALDGPACRIPWRRWLLGGLVLGGVAQTGYTVLQLIGIDPIWRGWEPAPHALLLQGTFGQHGLYGAYLAMLAPLAPLWLLPVFLVGLLLSYSAVAVGAAALGLLVRWRTREWGAWALALVALALVWWARGGVAAEAWTNRLDIAWRGLSGWLLAAPWQGLGAAAWSSIADPMQRVRVAPRGARELFVQAHNEYVQFAFEYGLVGVVLLCAFAWQHRRALRGRCGGALVSLALVSLAWFPFRVAPVAWTAVVVVGLALAEEPA